MLSQELTTEEREDLLRTCRAAAVAVAEYWDVLRGIELRLGREYDNSLAVIDSLAADCNVPPDFADITLDAVMDVIDEHLEVEREI